MVGFDTIVSFGDSYTGTKYLGLPISSADGPIWITRVSDALNVSLYNAAFPAATVDRRLATVLNDPSYDYVPDMLTQVATFLAAPLDGIKPIDPNKTQVSIWFGVNDTNGTSYRADPHAYHEKISQSFLNATGDLYKWGARRFLFTNVPAIWRAHYGIDAGPERQEKLRMTIEDFNQVLTSHISDWCAAHADAICSQHDLRPTFDDMMFKYSKYGFVDGTSYCPAYADRLYHPSEDHSQSPGCAPVPNYMWLNPLHMTWRAHIEIAKSALGALGLA